MWTATTEQPHSTMTEGVGYASGRLDEQGPREWRQDTVWMFGLAWSLLAELNVGRKPIHDTWAEWRETGRIAYTRRGRKQWITTETRNGTTGVATFAQARDIGEGDVIVVGPELIVLVGEVTEPYIGDGARQLITARGTNVLNGAVATVDMSPGRAVEVSRIIAARAAFGLPV